jgi:hypothetical protein
VKERVARQWEAVNKDSVEKGNHIKSEWTKWLTFTLLSI